MKLDHFEKAFVDNYLTNGYNATLAYKTLKPLVTQGSAGVLACRLLQRPRIKAALELKSSESAQEMIASKEYLIQEAHEIGIEARHEGKLNTALTAVETKGKLNKVFSADTDSSQDYSKLLKTIVIQNNVNIISNPENDNVVDVESVKDG